MVESGGRYLLMSALRDPKQLPGPQELLEEPSSCPRQWEPIPNAPHPSAKKIPPSSENPRFSLGPPVIWERDLPAGGRA